MRCILSLLPLPLPPRCILSLSPLPLIFSLFLLPLLFLFPLFSLPLIFPPFLLYIEPAFKVACWSACAGGEPQVNVPSWLLPRQCLVAAYPILAGGGTHLLA